MREFARERRFAGTGARSWAMANRDERRACGKRDRQRQRRELGKELGL